MQERAAMKSRGLLLRGWQRRPRFSPKDARASTAPAPGSSLPTNSSAAPPPARPTTFPTRGVTPGSLQPQGGAGIKRLLEKSAAGGAPATAYRMQCLFFCGKCCAACLCVPAGNYGNKASCPCYNNWKTKRGGPKCP